MRPRGDARYGLGLARFETDCGPVIGHTGNLLGTVTVVWARGDRMLVTAANAFPLDPAQEAALQRLLGLAVCG
jgi:D-alanyl-D-alanine carboxypeptidase